MKNKGFTLIELLAVIIILGLLMLIAIPSVTAYINNSRKEAYIDTAKEYIKGASTLVNSGELDVYDMEVTYYIPSSCIGLETGGQSPYGGKFAPAYILVTYNNDSFSYYWMSRDENGIGIKTPTASDKLTSDSIVSGLKESDISSSVGIDGRRNIIVFSGDCSYKEAPKPSTSLVTANGDEIEEPVSFANDSLETIIYAVQSGNTDVYNVGNTKTIEVGKYGSHKIRIANKSTSSECNGDNFSQTACGFVLEFIDVLTIRTYNPTLTSVGGWPDSEIRTFVNNDIYNALPEKLRNAIIDTKVISSYDMTHNTNFVSTDKIYLFSSYELKNQLSYDSLTSDQTRILDYYKNGGTKRKYYNGSYNSWWLRSVDSRYSSSCLYSNPYEGIYSGTATSSGIGVSPAFRIG